MIFIHFQSRNKAKEIIPCGLFQPAKRHLVLLDEFCQEVWRWLELRDTKLELGQLSESEHQVRNCANFSMRMLCHEKEAQRELRQLMRTNKMSDILSVHQCGFALAVVFELL